MARKIMEKSLAAACGLWCGCCGHLGVDCRGCMKQKGHPFWSKPEDDGCGIYKCCIVDRKLEHCGVCADFPCGRIVEYRDAGHGYPRCVESLARRAQVGTETWLREEKEYWKDRPKLFS